MMNPELEYILELIRRAPRDYRITPHIADPNLFVIKCPDGSKLLIRDLKIKENDK